MNRRGRSSLWSTPCTPWLTRCTTCTRTCVLAKSASAPRWTPSTARFCWSTSATSTSRVGLISDVEVGRKNWQSFILEHYLRLSQCDKSLCNVILEEWATLSRLPESRWSARPIFGITSALMQRHCENTVVCNYQAAECKLAPVNTRGWELWEGRQKWQNGLFFWGCAGVYHGGRCPTAFHLILAAVNCPRTDFLYSTSQPDEANRV